MTLRYEPSRDDDPWQHVTDTYWGHEYVKCKHCGGYTHIMDVLLLGIRKSPKKPKSVELTQTLPLILKGTVKLTRFMLSHLTCSAIYLENRDI